MLQRWTLLLIAILSYSGRGNEKPEPKTYNVPEAYAVYAAVLAAEHPENSLLIADTTVPFNQCANPHPDDKVNAAIKSYKKATNNRGDCTVLRVVTGLFHSRSWIICNNPIRKEDSPGAILAASKSLMYPQSASVRMEP
jgi:hypothetical protein